MRGRGNFVIVWVLQKDNFLNFFFNICYNMILASSNAVIAKCSSLDLLILGHLDITCIFYWIKFSRGREIPKLLPRRYVRHSFIQLSNKIHFSVLMIWIQNHMEFNRSTWFFLLISIGKGLMLNQIVSGGAGTVDIFSLQQLAFHDLLWGGRWG